MNLEEKIKNLEEDLTCPVCDLVINAASYFQNEGRQIKKGDWVVCSGCANALLVGDYDLMKAKPEQLKAADPATKKLLATAVKTMLISIASDKKNRRN